MEDGGGYNSYYENELDETYPSDQYSHVDRGSKWTSVCSLEEELWQKKRLLQMEIEIINLEMKLQAVKRDKKKKKKIRQTTASQ